MQRRMTELDKALYEMLEEYILSHGYAPSYSEISNALGISKSTVNYHIKNLQVLGLVQSDLNEPAPRAIRLASIQMQKVPQLA